MAFIGNTNTTQAFTPAVDYFSGNGSTTAFTLSRPVASVAQVQVVIDNVAQNPSSAYTISGNTITFTSAPLAGTNNIYVYYTSPITQVIAPGQGTVTATSMASSTGTGAAVFATSPTITTPTINQLTSAASTNLTLQSAGTTAVTIDTSQNVGVGTSSPVSKLNINGGAVTLAETTLGLYNIDFQSRTASTNARIQYDQVTNSTGQLLFYTNGGSLTERMRIDSSGNTIIGSNVSTTAVGQLSVYGAASTKTEIYMMRSGQVEGHIGFLSGSANSNWYFNTSGSLGNTGVYMTNNGTSWTSNSDERLKTDLQPIENATSKVASLRAVTGRYKTDVEGTSRAFLIAQDVQAVLPEAISTTHVEGDDTEYLGVAYTDVIPLLVASIKELKALVDAQATEIAELKAKVGV